MKYLLSIFFVLLLNFLSFAQYLIKGNILSKKGVPIIMANIVLKEINYITMSDKQGDFTLYNIPNGRYTLISFFHGFDKIEKVIEINNGDLTLSLTLNPIEKDLKEVVIKAEQKNNFGITYMNSIEGTSIYAAKKNERILLENIVINKSTNNTRQLFAKVAGINVWESDGAGLQLGIGARGLNPNRTTNFNTRQNGYDISADALGYPESYYNPPSEAIDRIDILRGAASLQYGTQFGGVLNFILKKGSKSKVLELVARQSIGSFGLSNTFVSVGGTKGAVNYYVLGQHKKGNGWRENSGFSTNTIFTSVNRQFSDKLNIGLEYTHMNYLTKQAGGLTDKQFEVNPRESSRERNWFNVDWNLFAIMIEYDVSSKTSISNKFFGLYSFRNALGELGRIDRADPLENRDLISGSFRNFGHELRLLHKYTFIAKLPSAFVIGSRYYKGNTISQQGEANDGQDADFSYNDANNLYSDYNFVNDNISFFAENMFRFSKKISVTPGIRYEYIETRANGVYSADIKHPITNQILLEINNNENKLSIRNLLLAGIGFSYKPFDNLEAYANYSQNYRAINFSDIKIVNPNFKVDNNMIDESGWNADLGIRGTYKDLLTFDITAFYLRYNNRIGSVLKNDTLTYQTYRLRTNVGDARNIGIESFVELDILKLLLTDSIPIGFSLFSNLSIINSEYISSLDKSVRIGNRVEYSPEYNLKTGAVFSYKNLKISYQLSYLSDQFTEATNASKPLPSATDGLIPSYNVMDLGCSYLYKRYKLECGINNLANNMYFTRRATAYPGPGIIPSNGRSWYLTLQIRL